MLARLGDCKRLGGLAVSFVLTANTHACGGRTGLYVSGSRPPDASSDNRADLDASRDGAPGVDALDLSAGGNHTCARLSDGTVRCWGENTFGELGNGKTTHSTTPVAVLNLTGVTALAAGLHHTCAVLRGGGVQCWGQNTYGQLGNGTTADSSTPVAALNVTGATALAAGYQHTCAVLSSGAVECWGDSITGQIGNGTASGPPTFDPACNGNLCCPPLATPPPPPPPPPGRPAPPPGLPVTTPVGVSNLSGAKAIAAGLYHTCAALTGGSVDCWGDNMASELGIGTATAPAQCCLNNGNPCATTPVKVASLGAVTALAAGAGHTCALLMDGTVQCWGSNGSGQLGNGGNRSFTPVAVSNLRGAVAVVAGSGAHVRAAFGRFRHVLGNQRCVPTR